MSESPVPISPVDPRPESAAPRSGSSASGAVLKRNLAPALGHKTAGGFVWLTGQSFAVKLVGMVSQVVLSWFLAREDFGAVAWAFTVATFASLVQEAGISQILVHRQARFRIWCTPAFWLSMTLGLLAAGLMAGAAPFVARVADEPQLAGLILVLALKSPVAAFGVPASAMLQNAMRFRLIALLGLLTALITSALNVLFAWRNFGAYSFVLPILIVTILRTAAVWYFARPPVRWSPQLRRWRYLLGQSGLSLAALGLFTYTSFGDYLILGLFHPIETVGDYFWAYGLSLQTTALLTASLAGVIFPALSRLQKEPDRQRRAFLRAGSAMELIGIPLCLLQAAVARPVVEILFDPKWLGAVPFLQILSIGMAMQLLNGPAVNLMQAQGRFLSLFRFALACAGLFTVLVVIGAWMRAALGVSIAVCVYTTIIGLACPYVAVRSIGGTWSEIVGMILKPFALAVPCVLLGYIMGEWIEPDAVSKTLLVCAISASAYLLLLHIVRPPGWVEITSRLRSIVRPAPGAA